jgi:DNA-binding HxlR family transcriptional regulator
MHDSESPLCSRFLAAAELMGRRWTGIILRILMDGPSRFGELTERIGTISERVLSERLKELEAEGLVERHVEPGPPIRSEYRLTEKGQDFWKVIDELGKWAERWVELKPAGKAAPRKRKSA